MQAIYYFKLQKGYQVKRAILFLGGIIDDYSKFNFASNENYHVYCADSGAKHAMILNLLPKFIIGDFDSIDKKTLEFFKGKTEFISFPPEKDFTDGELLIEKIYKDYDDILVLGGLGGEYHHTLGNILLLQKYPKLTLANENEELFLLKSENSFMDKKNFTISFIALDKENILSLKGFKYNLDNKLIRRGDTITLSNVIVEENAIATVTKGSFIGIIKQNKE